MGYSFLEPVKVGPFTLRNRITKSAMAEYICAGDGTVSDQYVEFYRTIAAGGASLVVPGIIPLVDPQDPPIFRGSKNPSMASDACIDEFKKVVDAVHGEGALIMFQIWHSGCYQTPEGLKSMVDDFTTEHDEAYRTKTGALLNYAALLNIGAIMDGITVQDYVADEIAREVIAENP